MTIPSLPSLLLSVLLLFCGFASTLSLSCTRHSHCDDGDTSTQDLCLHWHSQCISYPLYRQATHEDSSVSWTLPDLISETDKNPIPVKDKVETVLAAARVIGELNPNLNLYRNLYSLDIVDVLQNFAASINDSMSNFEFHAIMNKNFQRMNDAHTSYLTTDPLFSTVATLGFAVEIFFDKTDLNVEGIPRRRYVAKDMASVAFPKEGKFGSGSELITFNGERIDVAVKAAGIKSFGSNVAAQIISGSRLISFRSLAVDAVPLEPTVEIGFMNSDGTTGTTQLEWKFIQIKDPAVMEVVRSTSGVTTSLERRVRSQKNVFSKYKADIPTNLNEIARVLKGDKTRQGHDSGGVGGYLVNSQGSVRVSQKGPMPIPVGGFLEKFFSAEVIPTKFGLVGRLILKNFLMELDVPSLRELVNVLQAMPSNGLIVDIRNNGGGKASVVKAVAELVTGKAVPNSPLAFRVNQVTKDMVSSQDMSLLDAEIVEDISAVSSAILTAFDIGEPMSGPTSSLFTEFRLPGIYGGPIVTLANALSYGEGDVYAALQVDENMSLLVGTDDATGGGGATAMSYSELVETFPSIFKPLPKTVNSFSTSFSRWYRSGKNSGAIVENFAVEPDIRYYATYNDSMLDDCDMFEFVAEKLAMMRAQREPISQNPEPSEEATAEFADLEEIV